MRRTAAEKIELIRIVETSDLPVRETLRHLGLPKSTFYNWYQRYAAGGPEALEDRKPRRPSGWNRVSQDVRDQLIELALERTDMSARQLALHFTHEHRYFMSESTAYRILKSHDLITTPVYVLTSAEEKFQHPTRSVHEMWQTDFTYFRIAGWGWYYLSTILDDFSRYIITWKLTPSMGATDVQDTLDQAIAVTGIDGVPVRHRPRLLSDNGPAYVSAQLRDYLEDRGLEHTRGAPYHPQTQGKIERYHRSMKAVVKLENYYFPGELELALSNFVAYYNNERYHESLDNVTPADVYYGRHHAVLDERERIKHATMKLRRQEHQAAAAA